LKKTVMTFALTCLMAAALTGPAVAEMTLKFGLIAPPVHPHAKSIKIMSDYVTQRTGGEIKIDVYPLGPLGGERSMVEQVQSGTLDMADITTAVVANFVPEVAMFDLPFIWPSRGVAYAVLGDSELCRIIADAFPKRGMAAIGWGENGFRDLTNVKRPIRTPADVKGLKIRVMEAPVYLDTWQALGASPVAMPFPEVYNGLQQGIIDAQENPMLTAILMKYTEVCPYATVMNYSLAESVKIINIDLWKRLNPEQQQILREAGQLALKANREGTLYQMAGELAKLESAGHVRILSLNAEERAAFNRSMSAVYAKYEKMLGNIPDNAAYGRFAGMPYLKMLQFKIQQYN